MHPFLARTGRLTVIVLFAALLGFAPDSHAAARPNIIIILVG
jgi:hypothetical protein